jgi:hypothetical protein
MKKWGVLLCLQGMLFAAEEPWLTGPLIAPPGTITPYGSFMVQSYITYSKTIGYNNTILQASTSSENFTSLNPELYLYFGLSPWCDINIVPQFYYNSTDNQQSCQFGDLIVGFDFQLLEPDYTPYFPGIQLSIREVFPTGKYQSLDPQKLFTDLSGAGAFATQFNLILYKVFQVRKAHWLSTTVSLQSTISSLVHVRGASAYGGDSSTDGRVQPGSAFQMIVSFEYTLTQNWALALDNYYQHTNRATFSGNTGGKQVGAPSSGQFSLAPAIEYNFSKKLGIIGGVWFSVASRNAPQFISGVLNITYTY